MTIPKSKLGFLLAAVHVFIAIVIYYFEFECRLDLFYCLRIGIAAVLPFSLLVSLLAMFADIFRYFSLFQVYFFSVFVNSILFYFVGSLIQRKFSPKITRAVSIGLIIAAIVIMGILGIRYFNKSDIWKPDNIVNVNNPVNSGNYCQQDSDCVLVPQYQGCCPNGCEVEPVNVETKNKDEEARNKQYNCHLKKISCPQAQCVSLVNNQAICEQNRCAVKEKQPVNVNTDDNIIISLDETYYPKGETVNITIQNSRTNEIVITNIAVEKYSVNQLNKWKVIDRDIECPCNAICEKISIIIPTGSGKTFSWKQDTDELPSGIQKRELDCLKADAGRYRFKIDYAYGKMGEIQVIKTIYSNIFTITGDTMNQYKIIGSFTSPGESSFVKVLGDTVFLTDISEGLLAIDVSNPKKPVLLDKIKIGNGGAYALAIDSSGSYAVVSGYGNSKVALIDTRDPKNLRILNEIDAKRSVQDMAIVANNVYLAIDGPEVEVLALIFDDSLLESSIAKTITSKGVFQIQGGGHAIGLAVGINIGDPPTHDLIIAQGESGVGVYKKAEFMLPQFSSTSIKYSVGYVNTVAADENYVYAGVGNAIKVIDRKTQKKIIADIKVDGVWNFKVKNNMLYVASGENGVKVLDISDIRNPKEIAIIDTPGRARSIDVSIDGNYIYVADDRDDLQIIGL